MPGVPHLNLQTDPLEAFVLLIHSRRKRTNLLV